MISRNDPCWCGSGQKWKKCHYPKFYSAQAEEYLKKYGILLKTPSQIDGIRKSCRLAAFVLEETCKMAKAGVTTNQLNDFAHKLIVDAGSAPAPLHYGTPPFPKSICTSLNEVINHGIPDDTPLKDGDFLNIDVSNVLDGFYGDCGKMVAIGKIDDEKKFVMDVCYECMQRAINILKPGVLLKEIGQVIESYATSKGCSVVNEFVGHGTGINFHEPPDVCYHYNDSPVVLVEGMTFTIEPMINAGTRKSIIDKSNGWTARTADGRMSAQWEHTVLITKDGHEILTLP